jgi:hypothetical protein
MLEYPELEIFKQFRQVIVWGFPLHSHTHSYIHGAWVKTFKWLGVPVHWFHDKGFPDPASFDYSNSCFITEGWAEDKIPVRADCTYFVHIAKNPAKYLDAGARLIEIRYNVKEIHDFNYDYVLPTGAKSLSPQTLYEVVPNDAAVASRRGRPVHEKPYEAVYMYWATDLLPHEFNYDDAAIERNNKVVYYLGSVTPPHPVHDFVKVAQQKGVRVLLNNPWSRPMSFEDNIKLMKTSYCAPDFRTRGQADKAREYGQMNGTNHLDIGYIPCRVFKAISYGQTGITNSPRVKEILGEFVEYAASPEDVLPIVERRKDDVAWRQACMRHVAENHTFLQRARDLARTLATSRPSEPQKKSLTLVSAIYDIGRAAIDGRSMAHYKEYLKRTLVLFEDPIVLYLDPSLGWRQELETVRKGRPLHIIELPFAETKMYSYVAKITEILNDPAFQSTLRHPSDITNRLPGYCQIQYNKFDFIARTITANPFKSTHFGWIDAGISRFTPRPVRCVPTALIDPFVIQSNGAHSKVADLNPDTYIGTNECILKGGMWLFTPAVFDKVAAAVQDIWDNEMMAKGRLDNEQQALTLAYKAQPSLFHVCVAGGQIDGILKTFFTV